MGKSQGEGASTPNPAGAGRGPRADHPKKPKWLSGERPASGHAKKSAANRHVGAPPKKALAIRLRLGGSGKNLPNGARQNGQSSAAPQRAGSLKPPGHYSETAVGSSDDSDAEPQRKSPLGPHDTGMIVRKPRTQMRRVPSKHLKAAAALIGVKKPPTKRKPLPSARKSPPKTAAPGPSADEPDFLSLLAEAGEKLERDCNGYVEPFEASAKPEKSRPQPSWRQRAKESNPAPESDRKDEEATTTSEGDRAGPETNHASGADADRNGDVQKKGFKYRLKQKHRLRNTSPTMAGSHRGDNSEPRRLEQDAQNPKSSAPGPSPVVPRRPDSKPTRVQPSGRPNSLLQRLKEKASGGGSALTKTRNVPGGLSGSPSQKTSLVADMPAPAPRLAKDRQSSQDREVDIPLKALARAADVRPPPARDDRNEKEQRHRHSSPPLEDDSDDVDSTEDDDRLPDHHDSDNDDPATGSKRSRSGDDDEEAKRQRRIEANREAARQTIRRKRAHYEDMLAKEKQLEQANNMLYLDIEKVKHEVEMLQGHISWLHSLLEKASEEDREGRLRIFQALQSEQGRLEQHRLFMKARHADDLRQDADKKRAKDEKIRAFEEGGAPHREDFDDKRAAEAHHHRQEEERHAAEARHSEDRRRDMQRSNSFRDAGASGHSPKEWPFPRQSGPSGSWSKGLGNMPPVSAPGGFPPEMAALLASGMPPGMLPPPGSYPGPGMMPQMPTPEQMQAMAQSGGPPPWMFGGMPPELAAQIASQGGRPGPGGMSQQEAEATMHALASGAMPDMAGMMQDIPPGLRGMPPEMLARMMQGWHMHPGGPPTMMPPGPYPPDKAGPRPPSFGPKT